MSFTWGGLTEGPTTYAEEQPPPDAVTHTSSVEVLTMDKQDIGPAVEGGPAVFATLRRSGSPAASRAPGTPTTSGWSSRTGRKSSPGSSGSSARSTADRAVSY
ncbi:hypothetical protein GCM10022224_056570 [Nonomuraea antimicrobica]|uniref:Uncharacterized protein n=1 Tax=Nonomuraea antimicrobica TaxID=561173 RepID=A0ABP7CEC4_9ACTN